MRRNSPGQPTSQISLAFSTCNEFKTDTTRHLQRVSHQEIYAVKITINKKLGHFLSFIQLFDLDFWFSKLIDTEIPKQN